jgi:hypothetical protein
MAGWHEEEWDSEDLSMMHCCHIEGPRLLVKEVAMWV